jgi:hypothetical protein
MSERDAIFDRILFGDIYTDVLVEALYQAFKKRLVAELSKGEGAVVFVPLNPSPTEGR